MSDTVMVFGFYIVNLLQAQILITYIIKYGISALPIVSFVIVVCDMTPYSVVESYQLLEE
jgi:hypothetical protein